MLFCCFFCLDSWFSQSEVLFSQIVDLFCLVCEADLDWGYFLRINGWQNSDVFGDLVESSFVGLIDDFQDELNVLFGSFKFFEFAKDFDSGNFVLFLQQFQVLFEGFFWHVDFGPFRIVFRLGFFLFLFFLVFFWSNFLLLWGGVQGFGWYFTLNRIWMGLLFVVLGHCLRGIRVISEGLLVTRVLINSFERERLEFALFAHLGLKMI